MQLTTEQQMAVEAFESSASLRLFAYAGTGKTSTLVAMTAARRPRNPGLYIAFNKAIADHAGRKFDGAAECRTAHSLAWRAIAGTGMPVEKMKGAVTARVLLPIIEKMALRHWMPEYNQALLAKVAALIVRRFCQSADEIITEKHIPHLPHLKDVAATDLVAITRCIWAMMIDRSHEIPLGHDGYLKLWALGKPLLYFPFLLVDEAQDLNPVLLGVLERQTMQIVSVGDSYQQIYEWRGAIDALEHLPGEALRLTQSFRFGEEIASLASALLSGMNEPVGCRGNPAIVDEIAEESDDTEDAVLCRTNIGVIGVCLEILGKDRSAHIAGGYQELAVLLEDAKRLKAGLKPNSPEFLGFNHWDDVVEAAEEEHDLRTLVSLVDRFGVTELLGLLKSTQSEPGNGAVAISTAHKGKGLEWPHVRIHSDFERGEDPSLAERRLFYVAATRAQQRLTVDPQILEDYTGVKGKPRSKGRSGAKEALTFGE